MENPKPATTLVDGVEIATASAIEGAPAIRLSDDWDAAYHDDHRLVEIVMPNAEETRHLFLELDNIIKAVPRAQIETTVRRIKKDAGQTADEATATALGRARDLLTRYRRILESNALRTVFQVAEIHGTPYRGERIDVDELTRTVEELEGVVGPRD